jgi:hypothetical protein
VVRRLVPLALALMLAAPPVARADGDPASDVLPAQDIFFPYAPPTSKPLRDALTRVVEQSSKAGYPLKVALIESAGDLGSYPQMFNQPQIYANLLASELPTNPHGRIRTRPHLLVVMPVGFGGDNLGTKVDEALAPVKVDPAAQSAGLARAAIEAVARLATANGHPVAVPPEASAKLAASNKSTKRSSGPSPWLFVGPLLFVIAAIVLAGRISARRSRETAPSDDRPDA